MSQLEEPDTASISIPDAVEGGISDLCNGVLLKIFSLIDFGEQAGNRLSGIYKRCGKE